jgi:hypothetical protein
VNSPGFVADAALLLWVPISVVIFLVTRAKRAALITIFGGLLFLPEIDFFKFPFLPHLGKSAIPYLCALIGCFMHARRDFWRPPRERWVAVLVGMILAGGVGTALTNRDLLTVNFGKTPAPGLTLKDGMAVALTTVLQTAIPFFMGRGLFRSSKDARFLLRFVAAAGLVYSLFALFEVRMSPQLHTQVYGYAAHSDFMQTIRFGGYRPMVFMAHGLAVALFFLVTTLAAIGLGRANATVWRIPAGYVAVYLAGVLVLCKSTGAIAYGLAAIPLVALGSVNLKRRVSVLLAAVVLLYPVLRGADLFPVTGALSLAADIDANRKQSLEFRFVNEDLLLARARERPWFGWGEYGRNIVNDKQGNPTTVTDGAWIIVMGSQGAVGFVALFGMLVTPIFLAARRVRLIRNRQDRILLTTLSLMVAVTAVDLIPNGLFSNYPFFLSGALLSLSRGLAQEIPAALVEVREMVSGEIAYGRAEGLGLRASELRGNGPTASG